ncbi:MAG: hemerythrin family protein [Treponema sp.]|jgi:hemerythrin|nr:hemerythrin family protein [Treponema sp.]
MAYFTVEDLKTGNPLIDEQHKQLISGVNDLLAVCRQRRTEQFESGLAFIRYYTAKHFFDEEVLQIRYGYPGYAAHRASHDEFKITIRNFVLDLQENGGNLEDRAALYIGEWLVDHIRTEDMDLARHLAKETKIAIPA